MEVPRLAFALVPYLIVAAGCPITGRAQDAFGAVRETPELVTQATHNAVVRSIIFSPDGTLLASASEDDSVRIWSVADRRLLNTLTLGDIAEEGIAFAPSHLVAIRADADIVLWDWSQSQVSGTIPAGGGRSLVFSRDGNVLLAGTADGVAAWDVASLHLLWQTSCGGPARALAWFDHRRFLCGTSAGTIQLRTAETGRLVRVLPTQEEYLTAIHVDRDGGSIVALGVGSVTRTSLEHLDRTEAEHLEASAANVLAVSPNGRLVASGSRGIVSLDYSIAISDVASGRLLYSLEGHETPVTALAFSADGSMLASSSWDSSIRLWRVTGAAGEPLGPFDRQLGRPRIQTLALSADGRLMATAANEEVVSVWDLGAGTLAHRLTGHSNWVHASAFTADASRLATGSADNSLRLWNVDNGEAVGVLPGSADDEYATEAVQVASSPVDNVLAYTALDDGVRIWSVDAGRVVAARHVVGLGPALVLSPVAPVAAFGTSTDLKVWFWKTDELQSVAEVDGVTRLAFAPDGGVLAVAQTVSSSPSGDPLPEAERRHAVQLFAARDWSPLHRLDVPQQATALAFAADRKRVFVGLENGQLGVWGVERGQRLGGWASHAGAVTGLDVLPGGRVLVSAGEDGTVKLWAWGDQRLLATVQAFSSGDWLAFTPEGFFDGTRRAWNLAPFRFSSEPERLYEPEQFFLQFFQPGLLADIAREGAPMREILARRDEPRADIDIAAYRRSELPVVEIVSPASGTETAERTVTVVVEARDAGSGVKDCRIFRNGALVGREDTAPRDGDRVMRLDVPVRVAAGPNELSAYCFNDDGLKSKDAATTVIGADQLRREGTAYVIAAGVDRYVAPHRSLEYAVEDAELFAPVLAERLEQASTIEDAVTVVLADEKATKRNILGALSRLAGDGSVTELPAELDGLARAQPEDIVIVFFAGHGVARGDDYFLIPFQPVADVRSRASDAGSSDPVSGGVSADDLYRHFLGIDAGHIILVIDSCQSGQALEAEDQRLGPMNSRGFAQLAYEKGMHVLAAAQGYQAALEASVLQHGLLTYALVQEGLTEERAYRGRSGGIITARDWLDYAVARVPELQGIKIRQANAEGRALAFFDGEQGLDAEQRSRQRPRAFYRREAGERPLIVSKVAFGPGGKDAEQR